MAQPTVRVNGLKELNRAFKEYDKDAKKDLQAALRLIAVPVAADARRLASPFGEATVAGIAPGARVAGAVVRQRRRKTTGHHPEFGGLLMRRALEPALQENETKIVEGVERLFDTLAIKHGFG